MNDGNNLKKIIGDVLPKEAGFVKAEYEGPEIAVYVENMAPFFDDDSHVKRLATILKKKVIMRISFEGKEGKLGMDEKEREDVEKKIREIVPPEAEITQIHFDEAFFEVVLEAMKPGLVIGKRGLTLKKIIEETGWTPRILRAPTMPSTTIKGIRSAMLRESARRKKFLTALGEKINTPPPAEEKSKWVKITALGGFREVGRSCILLETNNDKFMLDCGINAETIEPSRAYPLLSEISVPIDEINGIIVTHAHLDHSGFVPYLFAYGYEGPVYCTPPTRDLMALLQFDYIGIMNKSGHNPPYTEKDVRKMLQYCVVRNYSQVTDVSPEVKLTFHNAAHILGSSMAHLHIGEGLHNLLYTGDFKYGKTKLFDQATTDFPRIETIIMESTYGGKDDIMPLRRESEQLLTDTIEKTINRGGKVLIPVFSVGRSQEIMLVLEEYSKINRLNFPVFLDGMIMEASAIHTVYPEYLKKNVEHRVLSNDSPFESEIFELVKNNRQEVIDGDPCVVLAPSGMLTGGPSIEYLKHLADNEKNMLIFVGYQSALSLGRKLQDGVRELALPDEEGKLKRMPVNIEVTTVEGFSGHSDRKQLISFARNVNPKPEKIITVHGEDKCEELAYTLNKLLRIETRSPAILDALRLR